MEKAKYPEILYIQGTSPSTILPITYYGFDETAKKDLNDGEVAIYKLVNIGKKTTNIIIE